MGVFDDLLAEAGYSTETPGISPVGQAIATGLALPSYGTPQMTPFEAQGYQTMTPREGALMTPATFGQLPAEQRSAIELESELRRQRLLEAAQPGLGLQIAEPTSAFLMNFGDAAAFGLGSELASAIEAPFTSEKTYADLIREAGTAKARAFQTNPLASIAGGITGSLAPIGFAAGVTRGAVQAGRLAPTLGEQLVTSTTSADLLRAANVANQATRLARLGEVSKIGALQGVIAGAGAAEPLQGESVATELKRRGLGAALGAGIGAAAPAAITATLGTAKALASPVKTFKDALGTFGLTPMTSNQAKAVIADVAEGAGITEAGLRAAKSDVDASGNPLLKTLTTTELIPTEGGQALRTISERKSDVGSKQFWAQEQQQIGRAMARLEAVADNIDMSDPATARAAQKEAQTLIAQRAEDLSAQGSALYDALPEGVSFSRNVLQSRLGDAYEKLFAPAKGKVNEAIQYAFDYINKRIVQPGGKLAKRSFSDFQAAPSISGRELVDLRSGLLAAGRDLIDKNPEQALLANRLAKEVHEFIKTDPKFATQFEEANKFWDDYIDTFHSQPLMNLKDPKIISPDTLNQHVVANSQRWNQFVKQTGESVKTIKEQLAIQFQRFKEAGADAKTFGAQIKSKLAVLDDLKRLVEDSPVSADLQKTYDLARIALTNIEELLTKAKGAREVLPPNFDQNMLKQMDLNDYAMIAAQASPKAGTMQKQAFSAAVRQFTRDKIRQSISRGIGGLGALGTGAAIAAAGGFSPLGVGAGAIATLGLAAAGLKGNRIAAQNAQLLNETLVSALRNPDDMLKAFAAKRAEQAVPSSEIISALNTTKLGKGATKIATALGAEGADVLSKELVKEKVIPESKPSGAFADLLEEANQSKAAPTPTATPTQKASLGEKIANTLVASAAAEESPKKPKKSAFPVVSDERLKLVDRGYKMTPNQQKAFLAKHYSPEDVKKVAKKYDKLTQAQIAVESNFNHANVSRAGAIGAMQIMPKTAKGFKVNPFNLEDNIRTGATYRKQLQDRFKSTKLALMAYNWGEGNVNKALKWLEKRKHKPTYENILRFANAIGVPAEARLYAAKVENVYKKMGG